MPELWATVAVQLTRDVTNGSILLFFTTAENWCLGTGRGFLSFRANAELLITTLNVSKAQTDPTGICPLPYTTTGVEVRVNDSAGAELLRTRFPVSYNFISP